jgi:hypothetical protein
MLDGYQPGDPTVRVFAYQAGAGRAGEEIAEEAFAILTTTRRTPPGRSRPAPTTGAGCGRYPSPETHRVAAGRVAFTVAPCGPDRRQGRRRADVLRVPARYKEVAPMTDEISQRPVPPLDPPERFAG